MKAKDFRREAWQKMHGKWGTLALITLVCTLIVGALSFSFILALLIAGPITLSFTMICNNIIRDESKPVLIEDTLKGFYDFTRAFVLWLVNTIFIFLWSLLLIIPGIIKSYSYSMSFYILSENPDMDANAARLLSIQMMKGNKWRLFCLDMSFIGWLLLCVLTLGILTFWITPYMETAHASFYNNLLREIGAAPAPGSAPDPKSESLTIPGPGNEPEEPFSDIYEGTLK